MLGNQISLTNNVAKQVVSVTATQNQTDFTVQGGYRINQLGVYRNGVRLVDGRDFLARNGSSVTLVSQGANAGDAMEFVVFDDFRVADALSVNTGGTVNAAVNIIGNLTVSGPDATDARIKIEDNNNGFAASEIGVENGGRDLKIAAPQDIYFEDVDTGVRHLYIESGGDVGIGTDNPGARTHIDSVTNNTPLVVEASQNNRSRIVFRNNVETGTECNIELFDDDLRFVTNSGERVRISANGRVGIGTTIPGAFLHAEVSNANTVLQLKRTDAPAKITSNFGGGDSALKYTVNDASSFLVGIDDSNSDAFKLSFGSSDDAAFGTNDFISVSTSGNIGINDTSPAYLLSVKDGDIASMKNVSAAGGNAVDMMRFRVENSADTSQKATLGGISAETVSSWGGSLTFHTKAASGTPNDTVVEQMRILSSGGITFGGDTAQANALNDYEEGTHVPTITLGSGSISTNHDDTLSYVKVGRLVHVQGRIHLTLSTADVSSFSFTLPFANCTSLAEQSEDTSAVTHVIRATTAGSNVDGIRHFRFTANSATVEMQDPDGANTGNFGVTNPHININLQYRST